MINVSDKTTGKIYTQLNNFGELRNWILTEGVKASRKGNIIIRETKRKKIEDGLIKIIENE